MLLPAFKRQQTFDDLVGGPAFCFALRIRQQLDLPLSLLLIAGQTNGRHIKIGTDALPIFKDQPANAQ
ncbi:MAG: hypothetical protein SPF51_04165 [Candidatus Fimivicinus sp.]|nr:hypothetical protein [Oscillospiraceae bacterium]MDY5590723.1 hypothetical protein [Candidatus Fimivicinus sp.]